MKNSIFIYVILLVAGVSCSSKAVKVAETNDFRNKFNISKIDSVNRNLLSQHLNYNIEGSIVALLPDSQKIVVYSADMKTVKDSIDLKIYNISSTIGAAYLLNFDSIFLLDFDTLFLCSREKVIYKKVLKDSKDIVLMQSATQHYFPFYINDNVLYIQRYYPACYEQQRVCGKEEVEAAYNLSSNQAKRLNITYPDYFNKNEYTVSLRSCARIHHDSLHIYSFKVSPEVYVMNMNTHAKDTLNLACSIQNEIKPFSALSRKKTDGKSQSVYDYFSTVSRYIHLIYDPYRKLYYRIYFHGQELKDENGLFNEYLSRKTFLLIFNSDFEKMAEIELDTKKYNHDLFPTSQGIAIPRRTKVNEKYQYDIYEISGL